MLLLVTAIAILLQVADYWTTIKAIESGKGREGNKFVKAFMDKLGLRLGLAVLKGVGVIVVGLLYTLGSIFGLAILTAIYSAVTVNNYRIYKST